MVRVRVIAAGINRADFYKLDGTYGASPTTGTFAAGMELAGIVETADPAAPHLPVGNPVMGVTVGAFADYVLSGHRRPDVKARDHLDRMLGEPTRKEVARACNTDIHQLSTAA
jgi:NADPH:quinone reductase